MKYMQIWKLAVCKSYAIVYRIETTSQSMSENDYPDYRPPNIAEQMEELRKQGSQGSEYNFEAGFKAIADAEYAKMAPIVEKLESIDKRLEALIVL